MKIYLKIMFLGLSLSAGKISAQATTNLNMPEKSAALDLRINNKGLLIPRLDLSTTSDITKIAGGVPAESLLVYNTNNAISGTEAAGVGYYRWDASGNIWKKLVSFAELPSPSWVQDGNSGTTESSNFIGTTDANDFVVKTNNSEKLRVKSSGNIGIGNSAPSYKLEVGGNATVRNNLFLGSADNAPENTAHLVVDNITGEVYSVLSASGNSKVYNYVKYTLSNVDQDYVANFDTKIPTSEYTVAIVGSSFDNYLTPNGGKFAPLSIYAYQQDSTWRIAADYVGAGSPRNGTWVIYCLILNNSVVNSLPDQVLNMGGSNTKAFANPPTGL